MTRTRILLLATHNPGKVREFEQLFAGLPLRLQSLTQSAPHLHVLEDGATFEDNARKKAMQIAQATGELVLSDDSGLEVDALGGRPGVHSARYAGENASDVDNNDKLVSELRLVADTVRSARYRVVLALADLHGPLGTNIHLEHGSCEGHIQLEPAGQNGFGYDPHFVPSGHACTMAQLEPEAKNQISHRARAAHHMRRFLQDYLLRGRHGGRV
jgi:XTP/dITP diphosphohydrolase